ncbi:Protein disulfide-isomerase TMX3 [Chionoecetes opilio]|uniref:Protein disulfide-isomerase TMX3 n=1 Tax=Chionoecetes opilio TaxID=41210 RepID=A0A8J5BXS0_CHIOP|nr:Protein disulfide-isomerase TMX3 [Chionoecetes opilio]
MICNEGRYEYNQNTVITCVSVLQCGTAVSKVLELSDRFLELRGESTWLVMFYAPWCGHCKKLEPIWNHVAYALYGTEIRVGRVDCTRFTAVATEFVVKGFPTIMYVQGDTRHTFIGDRTKEDIVGFAVRMAAPPVQRLAGHHQLAPLTQRPQHLFFIYVGTEEGHLWDLFKGYAERMRAFHYFYSIDAECMAENFKLESVPTVMVFKDDLHFFYPSKN